MCGQKNGEGQDAMGENEMIATDRPDEAPPRKASRETRREQLIEATLQVIAERGFARTTLTDVARSAGLSHGLVNFHFQTKERLFSETLGYLSQEYLLNWQSALDAAGDDPVCQLDALLRADFNAAICTPSRLAAWCAFWAEASSRPLYQQQCGPNDLRYGLIQQAICSKVIAQGGYDLRADRVARILRVTSEGVWIDMMTLVEPYSRQEALATLFTCAASFFPRQFTASGMIGR